MIDHSVQRLIYLSFYFCFVSNNESFSKNDIHSTSIRSSSKIPWNKIKNVGWKWAAQSRPSETKYAEERERETLRKNYNATVNRRVARAIHARTFMKYKSNVMHRTKVCWANKFRETRIGLGTKYRDNDDDDNNSWMNAKNQRHKIWEIKRRNWLTICAGCWGAVVEMRRERSIVSLFYFLCEF